MIDCLRSTGTNEGLGDIWEIIEIKAIYARFDDSQIIGKIGWKEIGFDSE